MKITRRQLRKMILEQMDVPDVMGTIGGGRFQPREEAPGTQPGYGVVKTLMVDRIQGVVSKLSGFSGRPSDDVIRAAVMDALDEVLGGTQ
jgi:hypothetical protein